jgi:hypothetical protein
LYFGDFAEESWQTTTIISVTTRIPPLRDIKL